MRLFYLAVLMAVLVPAVPLAQGGPPDCSGGQQDMNQCADSTARATDQDLNIRYRQAMDNARDDIARAKLRAAQRAWVSYRDAACEVEADSSRGGSIAPLLALSCLEHMTGRRALELTHNLERIDPGLWAGGALARLRENAPEEATRGVYWLPEGIVSADFNLDGRYDLAAAGLRPSGVDGAGSQVHILLLPAGASVPLHAVLPIGANGLCAAPVAVRVEYPSGKRPQLAIDDGACDAFRFTAEGTPLHLTYTWN